MNIWMPIFGVIGFYSLSRFFARGFDPLPAEKELLVWAMGFASCMAAISMIKIWAWMQMEKNNKVRELSDSNCRWLA